MSLAVVDRASKLRLPQIWERVQAVAKVRFGGFSSLVVGGGVWGGILSSPCFLPERRTFSAVLCGPGEVA